MLDLLVVEDDRNAREALRKALSKEGYRVRAAGSAAEAREASEAGAFDLALCDVVLPDGDGLELVGRLRRAGTAVVVMTAYATVDRAVKAMKEGAEDFLEKPIDLEKLRLVLRRAAGNAEIRDENRRLREALGKRYRFENIIGASPAMQEVFQVVEQVAPTKATVLLLGESGTGKELIANAIHHRSPRASGPLVKVNCAALAETLLESEMFGHEKGAFTGAIARRKGRFEAADGGTLFLDEVAEIPPATQVKLLRVLQEHTFERVGGNETIHADVRLVTATNVDVDQAVRAGKLREDLYYRLKVVTIRLPPLRDRRDDVPALARHFAAKFAAENGKPAPRIDPAAMASLAAYSWPGNVRELENVIENAVVMARGDVLTPDLVAMGGSPRPAPESEGVLRFLPGTPLAEVEKRMILDTLRAEGGNKSKAAERLGIGVRTLYRKIEEYGFKEFPREGRKECAPAGEGEPASEGESPGAPGEDGKK